MDEKAKRKEKPKYHIFSPNFRIIATLMALSLVLGIGILLSYFLSPAWEFEQWKAHYQETETFLVTKQGTFEAYLSGSATAATNNATATQAAMITATSTPMYTLHGTITLEDVFLTATALDCLCHFLGWQTATAEAQQSTSISIESIAQTPQYTMEYFHTPPTASPK
jgi:hypothetical protein